MSPTVNVSLDDILAGFSPDPVGRAIFNVTGWPVLCPGYSFPPQFRAWMSHPAFLDA